MELFFLLLEVHKDVVSLVHATFGSLLLVMQVLELKHLVYLRMFVLVVAYDLRSIYLPYFLVTLRQFNSLLLLSVVFQVFLKYFFFFFALVLLEVFFNDLVNTFYIYFLMLVTSSSSSFNLDVFLFSLLMSNSTHIALNIFKQFLFLYSLVGLGLWF